MNIEEQIKSLEDRVTALEELLKQESSKKTTPSTRFKRPTFEEVEAYTKGHLRIEFGCQNFLDYYEARDWMIGKVRVKDWKACIRTWVTRAASDGRPYLALPEEQVYIMDKAGAVMKLPKSQADEMIKKGNGKFFEDAIPYAPGAASQQTINLAQEFKDDLIGDI